MRKVQRQRRINPSPWDFGQNTKTSPKSKRAKSFASRSRRDLCWTSCWRKPRGLYKEVIVDSILVLIFSHFFYFRLVTPLAFEVLMKAEKRPIIWIEPLHHPLTDLFTSESVRLSIALSALRKWVNWKDVEQYLWFAL